MYLSRFVSAFLGAAALALTAGGAHAAFPEKPVTLVVGFSPGSSIDHVARTVAKSLAEKLGQPVVVENKSGAGGNLAADFVARSHADGYTLLVVANSIAISPALYKDLKFDARKDLSAVAYVGIGPVILKINKGLGIDNLGDLVKYAKTNPGKLNYASSGIGGTPHMATVLFNQIAGIDTTHIPYKGGADALAALLGGQVDLLINPLLGDTASDRITSLAITGEKRSPLAPDVPTFGELGYPAYDVGVYYGVMAPSGVPTAVIDKLNAAINDTLAAPEVVDTLETRSGIVLKAGTPQEFQTFLNEDMTRWADVVERNHVTVQ